MGHGNYTGHYELLIWALNTTYRVLQGVFFTGTPPKNSHHKLCVTVPKPQSMKSIRPKGLPTEVKLNILQCTPLEMALKTCFKTFTKTADPTHPTQGLRTLRGKLTGFSQKIFTFLLHFTKLHGQI